LTTAGSGGRTRPDRAHSGSANLRGGDAVEPARHGLDGRLGDDRRARGPRVVGKAATIVPTNGHGPVEVVGQPGRHVVAVVQLERPRLPVRSTERHPPGIEVETGAQPVDAPFAFAVDVLAVRLDDRERTVVAEPAVRPDRDPLEALVGVEGLDGIDEDALERRGRHRRSS
jgi:hypothetical protein